MRKFNSIAKAMLEESRKITSNDSFSSIREQIQNICTINDTKPILALNRDKSIISLTLENSSIVNHISEQIASYVQHLGYLTEVSTMNDSTSLTLRPFNESDFTRLMNLDLFTEADFNDADLDDLGCYLDVVFMPSKSDNLMFKVVGAFESGSTFDSFVEIAGKNVIETEYHYNNDDKDDFVVIRA